MNEREYEQKIAQCLPTLYRVARGILLNDHDCADAVQEAVLHGWIKRRQLRNADSFKAWMIRITVNECRNLQRRAMKQKKAVEASMEEMKQPPARRNLTELEAALSQLPEKYRLPIVLFYMENYPTREIAALMEIPEGRLRERMRTARKLLGRMLKDETDE